MDTFVRAETGEIVTRDAIQELSGGPFDATPTGLIVTDRDVPYEVWYAYVYRLSQVDKASPWIIGDALNIGERKYGEVYSQVLSFWNESDYDRIRNYSWVAYNVKIATRVAILSWTHHRTVAALDDTAQKYWLAKAVKHDWSKRELEEAIQRGPDEDDEEGGEYAFCWAKHESVKSWMEYRNQMAAWESAVINDKRDRGTAQYFIEVFHKYHKERAEALAPYLEDADG